MEKYDCSKILDYSHERYRMCKAYGVCKECPFGNLDIVCTSINDVTQEHIDIVQRWSDEHNQPERPKITHEEYAFLQAFRMTADKYLERKNGCMCLVAGNTMMRLRPSMFRFIREGETWPLGYLLKLEVADD